MKFRYTKYTGDLLDEIDLEDLVSKLSELLLTSGFNNPWGNPLDSDEDRTMQALHDAILEALFSGGVLSEEALQQLLGEPADGDQEKARQQLEDLIQQIIDKMMEQGFVTNAPDLEQEREHRRGAGGGYGEDAGPVKFEVTDKALDFLGYRALRDLLRPYRERYFISGEINTTLKGMQEVPKKLADIEAHYKDATLARLDGLSVDYPDWHFNVRGSNTEPLLRLNLEAETRDECDARVADVLAMVTSV